MKNNIIMIRIFLLLIFSYTFLHAQDEKMIKTKSGDFSIIDIGKGTPVLLLHGFPDSKELWKNQIPVLVNAGFRVIAPDLRGYGSSPSPLEKEKYAITILMNDVIGILDELKLDKVHLVGHDWGAGLSWYLSINHEQRLKSLTALSVGSPGNSAWFSREQHQRSQYINFFLQEGFAEKTFADNNWQLAKETFSSHKQFDHILQRLQEPNALTTALNWYRGNSHMFKQFSGDYEPSIEKPSIPEKKIEIPVLGIWSNMDEALTETQMKQSTDFAVNFTYKKMEGAGHWMMLDKPTELNSLILNFLKEQKR
jgi:pimeloyl-ACP methyl ester carboxylesterase